MTYINRKSKQGLSKSYLLPDITQGLGSIPALVLPSGGMAVRHRKDAIAELFFVINESNIGGQMDENDPQTSIWYNSINSEHLLTPNFKNSVGMEQTKTLVMDVYIVTQSRLNRDESNCEQHTLPRCARQTTTTATDASNIILLSVQKTDKILLQGDSNEHVGRNHSMWSVVPGRHVMGTVNNNVTDLLDFAPSTHSLSPTRGFASNCKTSPRGQSHTAATLIHLIALPFAGKTSGRLTIEPVNGERYLNKSAIVGMNRFFKNQEVLDDIKNRIYSLKEDLTQKFYKNPRFDYSIISDKKTDDTTSLGAYNLYAKRASFKDDVLFQQIVTDKPEEAATSPTVIEKVEYD
ncbi:hypothetical protein CLF_100733 [Clonorchis sinensis]|uniref:Uncharacterized protein n=1 Tax=Clonorchis sinensis TaxID=79923 RepID=G7Y444_CLOSI|nr:hypothetical protein CLF_100733 [Clonorchis sinensis]